MNDMAIYSSTYWWSKEMLAYTHSGFSVDTGVCIGATDRAGLERLLRYHAAGFPYPSCWSRVRHLG